MNLKEIIEQTYKVGEEAYEEALKYIEFLKFNKGDILIKQDEVCKYLYVIGEGVLRNFVINKEGEDHTRWFAEDGDLFTSLLSFKNGEPSIASVEALSGGYGWKISIEDAWHLINSYRDWSVWAVHLFSDGLAVMERRYKYLGVGDAYTRFCNMYKWRRAEVIMHIPLQHIASYLGVTPQSVSRFRRRFIKEN